MVCKEGRGEEIWIEEGMEIDIESSKNGTPMKHDETASHSLPEGFAPLAVEVSGFSLLSMLEDPGPFQHMELHKARRCVCVRSFDVGCHASLFVTIC